MKEFFHKITNSKYYIIFKRIITLDNDKRFLISSLAYYLLISLVPLCTILFYFLRLLHLDFTFILPLVSINLFNNTINEFSLIITSIVSIYIASKGLLNYFFYINDKFRLKKMKYLFLSSRIYSFLLTVSMCFLIAVIIALNSWLTSLNITFFNYFRWFINVGFVLILIILLNYFLLRKKIHLKNLFLGSLTTSILLNFSSIIYQYYIYTKNSKIQYYGQLTDMIILLLYIYLLSYFICLGNQINFMILKKESNDSLN